MPGVRRPRVPLLWIWILIASAGLTAGCASAEAQRPAKSPAFGPVAGDLRRETTKEDKKTEGEADEPRSPRDPAAGFPQVPVPPADKPQVAGQTTPSTPATAVEPQRDASMIIYTARVTMAVYQVDQGLATVERIAREQG